jgi:uncharacterized protein YukE
MNPLTRALIKMAEQTVQQVVSDFGKQLNVVEQMAANPLKTILQTVTDGAWEGKGATQFLDDVQTIAIPGVGQVGEHIQSFSGNLTRAKDIVVQADSQAHQAVNVLVDTFDRIFVA